MGKRCRQQYFQQPANYYQPRRNNCKQQLRTNCQQAMQAPSCAAPKDTFSSENTASEVKVETKQAEPLVLSEANLNEYGLDPAKYSVTNFYEASFNINGTQVAYLIVHDLRKDANPPIYMMPKVEAQSKAREGTLWGAEAQGTKSQHWKLANDALQKLVIAQSNEKAVAKEAEKTVVMPPVAETTEPKVMPAKPVTPEPVVDEKITGLRSSAPENFGFEDSSQIPAGNFLYDVEINGETNLIHLGSKGEVRVAPFNGEKVQGFKRLNPNREMLSNKDIWSPASDKLSKIVQEFRANQALDEGPRPPVIFAPEPKISQLPTVAMPDKESNTSPENSEIKESVPKPVVNEECLVNDSWLDKKTTKVVPEAYPDLSVTELLNLAPKRRTHEITAEDIKEVKELRPPIEFAAEPLVIKLPSPESLAISGLTKIVKEVPNGLTALKTFGINISNQYNEFQTKAKLAQEEALRNKMQPPIEFAPEPETAPLPAPDSLELIEDQVSGLAQDLIDWGVDIGTKLSDFEKRADRIRVTKDRTLPFESIEKSKLSSDPFKISISSISGISSRVEPNDDLPAQLSSGTKAPASSRVALKTPIMPEEKKSEPLKPKLPKKPMATSPADASKEKATGKLFTFDDAALKTLEKIGPTAKKSIFGSYDPKNSTVERVASDDGSINLVYSHPGQDAIAIKIYKEGKKVNLKATVTFANQDEAIEALKNTPASRLFTRTKEGGIYPLDRFPYLMYLVNNGETENSSYHSISADLKKIIEESGYELVRKEDGQQYTGLKQK